MKTLESKRLTVVSPNDDCRFPTGSASRALRKLEPEHARVSGTNSARREGFTLVELLAVLAIFAVWVALLIPAMARSRPTSESAQCIYNLKQVMAATVMYTQEYQELFPPNPDDGNTTPGYNWCAGQAGVGGADVFNPDILADIRRNLLAPYLNSNVSVFHCTADRRVGLYQGTNPGKVGQYVSAVRDISMSGAVGTIDPAFASGAGHSGKPTLPVNGPWLTGDHSNRHNNPWRTYGKTSDIVAPSPAGLFVFAEENPLSINDGGLQMSVGLSVWIDYPSNLHNLGGVLGFADAHVELHKWVGPALRLTGPVSQTVVPSTDPDWTWMAQRTSVRAK